ncbi:MAG: hypothetical protein KJ667_05460, partial [Alphaproteobacteria bacterium]|nr:hypothetical protein [Alphaproteobacteria bacterium]
MTLTILTNPRDLLYNPAMARYINYPGWCKSNFGLVVLPISYTLPSLLNTAINAALSRPLMTHLDMTMLLGMFGFLAGAAIHLPVNNYASKHGYGLTRGGKLVKAWQTAAY